MLPQEDALTRVQEPEFVKMDIEGGEWSILLDPRFGEGRTRVVVLEYHPHMCPGPVARVEADRLLRSADFAVVDSGLSEGAVPVRSRDALGRKVGDSNNSC